MKKLIFYILPGFFLFGCATLNPMNRFKDHENFKKADLLEYGEIKGDENIITGSLYFGPAVNMIDPEFMMNFDFGGEFKYHNIKFGELSGTYFRPIAFKQSYSAFDFYPSEQQIKQHQFSISYSLPLYKAKFEKNELLISGYDENRANHLILAPTKGLRKINLRLGYDQDYRRRYSDAYTLLLNEQYDDVSYNFSYEHPYGELNLSQQQFRVGGSYQACYNTNLSVVNQDGETIYGRAVITNNFYFDVLLAFNSRTDSVSYEYKINDGLGEVNYAESVDITNFIKKKPVGLALGYEVVSFSAKPKFFQSGYSIEVGFQPGFYETFKDSFYVAFGLKYGVGHCK